jgi:hypothetical protein
MVSRAGRRSSRSKGDAKILRWPRFGHRKGFEKAIEVALRYESTGERSSQKAKSGISAIPDDLTISASSN